MTLNDLDIWSSFMQECLSGVLSGYYPATAWAVSVPTTAWGGSDPTPRAISKTDGRRETDEAAFERSRGDASKPLSKI